MDMSAAALPPRAPSIPEAARSHPLFSEYQRYRSSCTRLMIDSSPWDSWLECRKFQQECDDWAKHPRFQDFQQWMFATKGGAKGKKSPGEFPENFKAWLSGARW